MSAEDNPDLIHQRTDRDDDYDDEDEQEYKIFRFSTSDDPEPSLDSSYTSTSSTSSPTAPLRSTKRLESYQRYLAKKSLHSSSSHSSSSLYRDRASERRSQSTNSDYSSTAHLEGANVSYEASKFLGGDEQHTHLVKGLDYQLLEKRKREKEKLEEEKLEEELERSRTTRQIEGSESSSGKSEPTITSSVASSIYSAVKEAENSQAFAPVDLFLPGRLSYQFPLRPILSSLTKSSFSHAHESESSSSLVNYISPLTLHQRAAFEIPLSLLQTKFDIQLKQKQEIDLTRKKNQPLQLDSRVREEAIKEIGQVFQRAREKKENKKRVGEQTRGTPTTSTSSVPSASSVHCISSTVPSESFASAPAVKPALISVADDDDDMFGPSPSRSPSSSSSPSFTIPKPVSINNQPASSISVKFSKTSSASSSSSRSISTSFSRPIRTGKYFDLGEDDETTASAPSAAPTEKHINTSSISTTNTASTLSLLPHLLPSSLSKSSSSSAKAAAAAASLAATEASAKAMAQASRSKKRGLAMVGEMNGNRGEREEEEEEEEEGGRERSRFGRFGGGYEFEEEEEEEFGGGGKRDDGRKRSGKSDDGYAVVTALLHKRDPTRFADMAPAAMKRNKILHGFRK